MSFVDFDLSDPAINPMLSTSDFHIGEIPLISIRDNINFENDILRPVEKHLSQVCNNLATAWERRINTVNSTQPVLKDAHELFTLLANEDVLAIDSLTTFNKISVKLENVFKQLPPRVRLLYEKDMEKIKVGCFIWLKHCQSEKCLLQNTTDDDTEKHELFYETFVKNII